MTRFSYGHMTEICRVCRRAVRPSSRRRATAKRRVRRRERQDARREIRSCRDC